MRSIGHAAVETAGSRADASRWITLHKQHGDLGLRDRSTAPLRQRLLGWRGAEPPGLLRLPQQQPMNSLTCRGGHPSNGVVAALEATLPGQEMPEGEPLRCSRQTAWWMHFHHCGSLSFRIPAAGDWHDWHHRRARLPSSTRAAFRIVGGAKCTHSGVRRRRHGSTTLTLGAAGLGNILAAPLDFRTTGAKSVRCLVKSSWPMNTRSFAIAVNSTAWWAVAVER
jgi:hypothetical protein